MSIKPDLSRGCFTVDIPPLEAGEYELEIRINGALVSKGGLTVVRVSWLRRLIAKLRSLKPLRKPKQES